MTDRSAAFLAFTSIVNGDHPQIAALAAQLAAAHTSDAAVAQSCFEWVRDQVSHSGDARADRVTCTASDVLQAGTGYCYAKSHLLAALLRANRIPAGFVYQRLALDDNGEAFCLHGLNAVWLKAHGWYRLDARGNREGLTTRFEPPREVLAFVPTLPGERLLAGIGSAPLPHVVSALESHPTRMALEAHLPDLDVLDLGNAMPHGVVERCPR